MSDDGAISAFALGFVVLAGGLVLLAATSRVLWKRLQPTLFPPEQSGDAAPGGTGLGRRPGKAWVQDVGAVIAQAESKLAADRTPTAQEAAWLAKRIAADVAGVLPALRRMLQKTLDSAQLQSLLVRSNGVAVYVVGVPGRHENHHLIRRYPAFSKGWVSHFELMHAALMEDPGLSGLMGLVFFFSPDQRDGVLLVSYGDRQGTLHPKELMNEAELRALPCQGAGGRVAFQMDA